MCLLVPFKPNKQQFSRIWKGADQRLTIGGVIASFSIASTSIISKSMFDLCALRDLRPPLQWDDQWIGFPIRRVWGHGGSQKEAWIRNRLLSTSQPQHPDPNKKMERMGQSREYCQSFWALTYGDKSCTGANKIKQGKHALEAHD